MAGGLGGGFSFGAATTAYTGGLFGAPSPAVSTFAYSAPLPVSYFSPPVMTSTTAHLFRGSGGSYPYSGGVLPASHRVEKKK